MEHGRLLCDSNCYDREKRVFLFLHLSIHRQVLFSGLCLL